MFQTLRRPHVLHGVRPFVLKGFKLMEDAAPQDWSKGTSEGGSRSGLEQDEEALHRLLSRAELELSDPDAVQRRETMARLKLATASAKAEHAPEAPGSVQA